MPLGLRFPVNDERVDWADDAYYDTVDTEVTVMLWFKVITWDNNFKHIFGRSNFWAVRLGDSSNGDLQLRWNDTSGGAQSLTDIVGVDTTDWIHCAVTSEQSVANNIYTYKVSNDTEYSASGAGPTANFDNGAQAITVAERNDGLQDADIEACCCKIWNKALTFDEVFLERQYAMPITNLDTCIIASPLGIQDPEPNYATTIQGKVGNYVGTPDAATGGPPISWAPTPKMKSILFTEGVAGAIQTLINGGLSYGSERLNSGLIG